MVQRNVFGCFPNTLLDGVFIFEFRELAGDQTQYDRLILDKAQRLEAAGAFAVVLEEESVDAVAAEENFEILSDLGSGMNYCRKGLVRLLNLLVEGEINRLVITHKDRLLRFGAELVFAICEMKHIEVVIINQGEESSFEEDLAKDVLEIIAVFSARLCGSRSKKNKKLLEGMKKAVAEAEG